MPVLGGLVLLIQIAFAIHVVRTGRETFWIYIIAFLPGIGCAVYFFTQVLPEMRHSRTVRSASNRLLKAIDPERELRRRKDELEIADTVANRVKLAAECIEAGFHDDAIALLQRCQQNGHDDPDILLKLAQAQFGAGQFQSSVATLDTLIQANPNFRSHDGHLLYARSLEALGKIPQALEEFQALAATYPGEEARWHYAQLLQQSGQTGRARQVLEDIQLRARRAPKYYRRKEQEWIKQAEQMLKTLQT
ncbi:MAG TPA: tetratricopeptide repeat protein [Candidatus Thiothrix moscowensis]|uniref:tetratricopeptide repeat protein n=1 Tax=unclassified Thiothrix TaxID=2636184 RepID=UPI0025FEA736|nr:MULTISPECIES: tetratricopeptide repeat protein [unclassified Thiothrix]HRJ53433.1 tetratricopeptide repeat protein [Candidatus Thiothrix moscowensis]HRJ93512.1 tetratricopeptide repeat protein [Candidatus Thiothrix moscowensis]